MMLSLKKVRKLSGDNPTLSWLFAAFFEDGDVIIQRQEDEIGHSKMIDVHAKARKSPLVAFELRHTDGKQAVTVDLKTGAFIVNGTPLEAQSDFNFDKGKHFNPSKHNLELAYWREKCEQANVSAKVEDDMSVSTDVTQLPSYINRYFIGWTCKAEDKQAILAVG
jgi:hypothetical protein